MDRREAQERVEDELRSRGFVVSRHCDVRPGSFDYVARRGDVVLLLKVSPDIDSVIEEAAREMRRIARTLRGYSIVVGERAGQKRLERGTAYFRYGLPAIGADTFEDLLDGEPVLVYAAPGGEYVNIEGEKLRRVRAEQGLSRGDLASELGVSRSMVRRYEEGEANATAQICIKMEDALNAALIRPVDLEPRRQPGDGDVGYGDRLERRTSTSLVKIGLRVVPTRRAPFNAVSSDGDEFMLTGVSREESGISRRASLMKEISDVIDSRSVFIIEDQSHESVEEIPLVGVDELLEIEEPEGLFDLIEDRCS